MSKNRPYRYPLYLLLRLLQGMSLVLPRLFMLGFAKVAGKMAWRILPKERRRVFQHLELAFGDSKTQKEFNRIGEAVFQNLGKTAVDTLRMPKLKKKILQSGFVFCDPSTFKKMDQAHEAGNGIIILTGHIGNWELVALFMMSHGYPSGAIVRRIYYEPFNRVLESVRRSTGVQVIYRDESPKAILTLLKNNQTVGILPDQDVDSVDGIFVPFFGKLAYTPTAPAKLSLASRAPILPMFMLRDGLKYRFVADELIWPELELSREEAVIKMTKQWSASVESIVRQFPEQWVWMHRRWKTQENMTGKVSKGHE